MMNCSSGVGALRIPMLNIVMLIFITLRGDDVKALGHLGHQEVIPERRNGAAGGLHEPAGRRPANAQEGLSSSPVRRVEHPGSPSAEIRSCNARLVENRRSGRSE